MSLVTAETMLDQYGAALDIAVLWLRRQLTSAEESIVEEIVTPTTVAAAQARIELLGQDLI